MYQLRRKLFSQNFLHNRKLVSKLVRSSSIGKNDLVLEIGPGKGIITEALLLQAQHVLAVEIDSHWYSYLHDRLGLVRDLTLFREDILNFKLPVLPYKVFANIPFSIEGNVLRYLIDAKNPPIDCYLVVMKKFGYRMVAPYRENLFSLTHKPWFEFSLNHHFERTDFQPVPSVDSVMMRFVKRKQPILSWSERDRYSKFLEIGFGHGLPVWQNLKKRFGIDKTSRILSPMRINKTTRPTDLSLRDWGQLYKNFVNIFHIR
jgi:23S rRNA (adenine-N6)-dimethyltransferase